MKEFNLSDRIIEKYKNHRDTGMLEVVDVKEFIRLLKERMEEDADKNDLLPLDWCLARIDKLAGDKLI